MITLFWYGSIISGVGLGLALVSAAFKDLFPFIVGAALMVAGGVMMISSGVTP